MIPPRCFDLKLVPYTSLVWDSARQFEKVACAGSPSESIQVRIITLTVRRRGIDDLIRRLFL